MLLSLIYVLFYLFISVKVLAMSSEANKVDYNSHEGIVIMIVWPSIVMMNIINKVLIRM